MFTDFCNFDLTFLRCDKKHKAAAQRLCKMIVGCPPMPFYPPNEDGVKRVLRERSYDIVHKAIIKEWDDLQRLNPNYFVETIQVWPVTSFKPRMQDLGYSDIKIFCFLPLGYCPHAIPVQIVQADEKQSILLRVNQGWHTLDTWVSQFFDTHAGVSQSTMVKWHEYSGKTFPLMALPAEIRLDIFRYSLFPDDSTVALPYFKQPKRSALFVHPVPTRKSSHNLDLLRVSHQVGREASQAFWSTARVHFFTPLALERFWRRMQHTQTADMIRHIALNFSFEEYYHLFGARINNSHCYVAPRKELIWLASLPDLENIGIQIPRFAALQHTPDLFSGLPTHDDRRAGCQAVAVNALMDAAIPALKACKPSVPFIWNEVKYYQQLEFSQRLAAQAKGHKDTKQARQAWDYGPFHLRLERLRNSMPEPFWSYDCECKTKCRADRPFRPDEAEDEEVNDDEEFEENGEEINWE